LEASDLPEAEGGGGTKKQSHLAAIRAAFHRFLDKLREVQWVDFFLRTWCATGSIRFHSSPGLVLVDDEYGHVVRMWSRLNSELRAMSALLFCREDVPGGVDPVWRWVEDNRWNYGGVSEGRGGGRGGSVLIPPELQNSPSFVAVEKFLIFCRFLFDCLGDEEGRRLLPPSTLLDGRWPCPSPSYQLQSCVASFFQHQWSNPLLIQVYSTYMYKPQDQWLLTQMIWYNLMGSFPQLESWSEGGEGKRSLLAPKTTKLEEAKEDDDEAVEKAKEQKSKFLEKRVRN
jgi:hypothetical protein